MSSTWHYFLSVVIGIFEISAIFSVALVFYLIAASAYQDFRAKRKGLRDPNTIFSMPSREMQSYARQDAAMTAAIYTANRETPFNLRKRVLDSYKSNDDAIFETLKEI